MARSFANAKLLSAIVTDVVSPTFRRGFAAAAQAVPSSAKVSSGTAVINKAAGEEPATSSFNGTWGPDPTTGYYRPESGVEEIDVAELRAALLKKNKN